MGILRSVLFAPGNHLRRMEKTLELPVDGVILDLEDAVAISEKPAARATVCAWLARPRGRRLGFVRVNALSTPFALGDLMAVVVPGLDGIVLPKTECSADLHTAAFVIANMERERGLPDGRIEILPIVETARGLDAVDEIARATPRVRRIAFGSGDFSNDTRTPWSRDNPLLLWGRARLVIASRAAGIEPPIDSVFARLDDREGFLADIQEGKMMGFQGKMLIHPSQVEPINTAFSPSQEEIDTARAICEAFAEAERNGSSAIVVNGTFVDYPVVHRARQALEAAEALGSTAG